jgi:hypothetical protein
MITFVQDLVTSGKLNHGHATSLIFKLNAAMEKIDYGNSNVAIKELNSYINQVNIYIRTGKLSSIDGQTLINGANAVINAIK